MNKKLATVLKVVVPIGIGIALILFSLNSMNNQVRTALWNNIKDANLFWVGASLFLGFASHFLRAYRWKYLLEPLGCYPRLHNSFMAVMIAYLANLGVPRSGEVLRGVTISRYEKISFQKAFGTIISERVADLVLLLAVVAAAFFMQSGNLINYFEQQKVNPFFTLVVIGAGLILFIVFLKFIKQSKHPWLIKINSFLTGIMEGIKSILSMRQKGAFIFFTLLIWALYILMFWVVKFAVPGMQDTPWGTILVAFVAGSFSMSTTNGGLGIFPYPIVVGAIFVFSGIPQEQGEAFGWIIWGSQTVLNIIIGGLSFIFLPILNSKK